MNLVRQEMPKGVKKKLLERANLQIFTYDVYELFGINLPQAVKDVAESITKQTEKTNKKNE